MGNPSTHAFILEKKMNNTIKREVVEPQATIAKLPHVSAVLAHFKSMEFNSQENKIGSVTIQQSTRRKMKQELMEAVKADFNEGIANELCETIENDDGMMMVIQQDIEGFITVEVDLKFKNLDYDPLD